jgi:uncharacterized protein YbbK (DUF523 family)
MVGMENRRSRVLVSACLLGAEVRYHGGAARVESPILQRWREEGRIVGVCPEVAGGLPSPRPPAEIQGPSVIAKDGRDVTAAFTAGADSAVNIARELGIRVAVLKSRSPSCGIGQIYDGSFAGRLVAGSGITATALKHVGIRVFDEDQLPEADALLRDLDAAGDNGQ